MSQSWRSLRVLSKLSMIPFLLDLILERNLQIPRQHHHCEHDLVKNLLLWTWTSSPSHCSHHTPLPQVPTLQPNRPSHHLALHSRTTHRESRRLHLQSPMSRASNPCYLEN